MNARDVILIGVLVFFFGIGFFILHNLVGQTVDKLVSIPAIQESQASVDAFQGMKTTTNRLDYLIFGLFIALVIALLIGSWFIAGNPIFIVIYIIVIIIGVLFATVLANVWETTTQSSVFGSTINSFPITNNLLNNLPLYNAIVGVLGMIIMFAKKQMDGGYGGSEY